MTWKIRDEKNKSERRIETWEEFEAEVLELNRDWPTSAAKLVEEIKNLRASYMRGAASMVKKKLRLLQMDAIKLLPESPWMFRASEEEMRKRFVEAKKLDRIHAEKKLEEEKEEEKKIRELQKLSEKPHIQLETPHIQSEKPHIKPEKKMLKKGGKMKRNELRVKLYFRGCIESEFECLPGEGLEIGKARVLMMVIGLARMFTREKSGFKVTELETKEKLVQKERRKVVDKTDFISVMDKVEKKIEAVKEIKVKELPFCDFCRAEGESIPAKYDGTTTVDTWAFMCRKHFLTYGIGLGLGKGQKFFLEKK